MFVVFLVCFLTVNVEFGVLWAACLNRLKALNPLCEALCACEEMTVCSIWLAVKTILSSPVDCGRIITSNLCKHPHAYINSWTYVCTYWGNHLCSLLSATSQLAMRVFFLSRRVCRNIFGRVTYCTVCQWLMETEIWSECRCFYRTEASWRVCLPSDTDAVEERRK